MNQLAGDGPTRRAAATHSHRPGLPAILDALRPGRTVYLPGTTGEISVLAQTLRGEPDRARGVHFASCFVPGMNEFDYAALHPTARVSTFMLPAAMRGSFAEGRVDLIPRTYFGIVQVLAALNFDVAVAHVAAPDREGRCSLGIAGDFTTLVWPRAAYRILLINPLMPAMRRGPALDVAHADLVVEAECPLVEASAPPVSSEADAIAAIVAGLIPDGARLQTGLGSVPAALWAHLRGHRELVLRSGMANDGLRILAEGGALAAGGQRAGIAYGSRAFYDYLARTDLVEFATTLETHNSAALANEPLFHAVNSALEVDLFGQVNVEWRGGSIFSGVGGSADFARAALCSQGGRSIIALPSTAKAGAVSRIVPGLSAPAIGLARTDVDRVVTECGVAELRHKGIDARAESLIAIAHPSMRDDLAYAWRSIRPSL